MSTDFYEKLILLLVTALLSGLLVPYILKKYEAVKTRQNAIAAAQTELLDKLSSTIWGWRYLARTVPYYAATDPERYDEAKKNYEEKLWDYLRDFRIQSSKARQLLSEDIFVQFHDFYDYIINIDLEVQDLINIEDETEKFHQIAERLSEEFHETVTERIEDMLITIARDLKLTTKSK